MMLMRRKIQSLNSQKIAKLAELSATPDLFILSTRHNKHNKNTLEQTINDTMVKKYEFLYHYDSQVQSNLI